MRFGIPLEESKLYNLLTASDYNLNQVTVYQVIYFHFCIIVADCLTYRIFKLLSRTWCVVNLKINSYYNNDNEINIES